MAAAGTDGLALICFSLFDLMDDEDMFDVVLVPVAVVVEPGDENRRWSNILINSSLSRRYYLLFAFDWANYLNCHSMTIPRSHSTFVPADCDGSRSQWQSWHLATRRRLPLAGTRRKRRLSSRESFRTEIRTDYNFMSLNNI